MNRREFIGLSAALGLTGCTTLREVAPSSDITMFTPDARRYFPEGASLETLGKGYGWSEGPTWNRARDVLYFTDVPGNMAYVWQDGMGVDVFLSPSGGTVTEGFREPGANGLWYARDGSLLIANHGTRSVERMGLATRARTTVAAHYDDKPFNSPNDLVEASDGTVYFSDPPYGLEGLNDSPLKKMKVNGVYRVKPDGEVDRLLDDMTFPNGVALSPDETTLYIAQSDPDMPILRAIDLACGATRTLFDFAPYLAEGLPGLPDGIAVAGTGEIFVTGPGGVYLLDGNGGLLARIETGVATANCAFGEDGSTLFITAHSQLLRIPTRLKGVQWD